MSATGSPPGTSLAARIRAEWALPITRLLFGTVLATAIALWWLERLHVTAREPLWVLLVALLGGYFLSWTAHLAYLGQPSVRRLHLRIAVQVAIVTVLMYLTGWGPALTLGYVFVARDNLTVGHGRSWRAIIIYVAVALVAGQVAISVGLAPTFLHPPSEYGLAVLSALAVLSVIGFLGVSAVQVAEAQGSLRKSEERLRTTLETANDAYVEFDGVGVVRDWNSQAERIFGWKRPEAIGRRGADLILPEDARDAEAHQRGLAQLATAGESDLLGERHELVAQHRDGHRFPIELTLWRTRDCGGVRFHVFAHDITQRKESEAALRKSQADFRMLFSRHPHPMWVCDFATLAFVEVNEAALTHYGYSRDEFLAMTMEQIWPPDDGDRWVPSPTIAFDELEPPRPGVWRHRTKAGALIDVDIASHRLTFDGRDCLLVMAQDVSERRRFEDQLRHQALHDALTGLPNRAFLLDRASRLLAGTEETGTPAAALYLDLDNFKEVNDSLGHLVGDELLQRVAARLSEAIPETDTVGRMGGDEFVVLAGGSPSAATPEALADRLLEVIRSAPFHLVGRDITVTASIGIAIGGAHEAADLLRNADVALYQAKARGRNGSAVFLPEMQSAVHERLELALDLQNALAHEQFELHYQPVVGLNDLDLTGAEALIRWRHPTVGWVPPERFIPLAEETGAIDHIGRWALRQACRDGAAWRRAHPTMTVAVNVSAVQLATDRFVDDVRDALEMSKLEPSGLVLEISESILMADADATVHRLQRLKDLGVRLAIDDFGTGFSSLSYLPQFPVDILKIDRTFVATVTTSAQTAALVQTVIRLGAALDLEIVAEGVESRDQLIALREVGCQKAQGFLFAKPIPKDSIDYLFSTSRLVGVRSGPS